MTMTWAEYYYFCKSTDTMPSMQHIGFGLLEEAGEVAGKLKRLYREHGGVVNDEWKRATLLELGDVLWHVVELARQLDSDIETVKDLNVEKIRDRRDRGVIRGEGDNR